MVSLDLNGLAQVSVHLGISGCGEVVSDASEHGKVSIVKVMPADAGKTSSLISSQT